MSAAAGTWNGGHWVSCPIGDKDTSEGESTGLSWLTGGLRPSE